MKPIPILISKNPIEKGVVSLSVEITENEILRKLVGVGIFQEKETDQETQNALGGIFVTKSADELEKRFGDTFKAFHGYVKRIDLNIGVISQTPMLFFDKKITFYNGTVYEQCREDELDNKSYIMKNEEFFKDASDKYAYDPFDGCVYYKESGKQGIYTIIIQRDSDGRAQEYFYEAKPIENSTNTLRLRFVISKNGTQMSVSILNNQSQCFDVLSQLFSYDSLSDYFYLGVTDINVKNVTLIKPKDREVEYVIED